MKSPGDTTNAMYRKKQTTQAASGVVALVVDGFSSTSRFHGFLMFTLEYDFPTVSMSSAGDIDGDGGGSASGNFIL